MNGRPTLLYQVLVAYSCRLVEGWLTVVPHTDYYSDSVSEAKQMIIYLMKVFRLQH